jgi:hypothetical protein
LLELSVTNGAKVASRYPPSARSPPFPQ